MPSLASFDWMPGLDDPVGARPRPDVRTRLAGFLDRYADELPQRCLRWCEQFVEGIPAWIEGHQDDPVTLIHGDFRLDNLFFADDGSVAVVDWQLAMRAPGQTDLVYFCANNLIVSDRRELEDELIERYVDGVHAAGIPADRVTLEGVRQRLHRGDALLRRVVRGELADDRSGERAGRRAVRRVGAAHVRCGRRPSDRWGLTN